MGRNARRTSPMIAAAILSAAALAVSPATSRASAGPNTIYEGDQWKIKIDIDPAVIKEAGKEVWNFGKKVYKRIGTDHPERKYVYDINGKKVVLVQITSSAGGTRLTNNINFTEVWDHDPDVRIFVASRNGDPNAMAFRLKKDVNWGGDENKSGDNLRHGVRIRNFSAGSRRYFANRSSTVHWGGFLVIADAGLSKSDIDGIRGLSIR